MLMIFDSEGKDVTEASWQDIMRNKNMGQFFNGFSCLETPMPAGKYTIIIAPEEN